MQYLPIVIIINTEEKPRQCANKNHHCAGPSVHSTQTHITQ